MRYDLFTFLNEYDILELRLNILDPYVDHFVLTESPQTFSGKPKSLYYEENKERFKRWNHKIVHNIVGEYATDNPFERAYYQKEHALSLITDPEAEVYFGDVDEIWTPQNTEGVVKLHQYNYSYYLNQRSSEDWYGTIYGKRKYLDRGLNNLRAEAPKQEIMAGWHFTNMGGIDQIKKKMASYDHAHEVIGREVGLKERMDSGKDYLGREQDYQGKPFTFWLEEENWPQFLKDNRDDYAHLCYDTR